MFEIVVDKRGDEQGESKRVTGYERERGKGMKEMKKVVIEE